MGTSVTGYRPSIECALPFAFSASRHWLTVIRDAVVLVTLAYRLGRFWSVVGRGFEPVASWTNTQTVIKTAIARIGP
jgi:hypothetical protein